MYLNQYRRNVNTAGEKVDQNRVVLTMVPVDGEWKVVKATARSDAVLPAPGVTLAACP